MCTCTPRRVLSRGVTCVRQISFMTKWHPTGGGSVEAVGKRWGGPQIAVAVEMVGGAAERRNVSEVKVERVGA